MDNPRIYDTPQNWSPYLGYTYSEKSVWFEIEKISEKVSYEIVDDDYVIQKMINKKIAKSLKFLKNLRLIHNNKWNNKNKTTKRLILIIIL